MRPHFNSYGTKRAEMPINNSAAANKNSSAPRTQAQTGHEHGDDYRNQSCRNPKTSHRESQPNNLVHQAAEAGDDKENEVPPHAWRNVLRLVSSRSLVRNF